MLCNIFSLFVSYVKEIKVCQLKVRLTEMKMICFQGCSMLTILDKILPAIISKVYSIKT